MRHLLPSKGLLELLGAAEARKLSAGIAITVNVLVSGPSPKVSISVLHAQRLKTFILYL